MSINPQHEYYPMAENKREIFTPVVKGEPDDPLWVQSTESCLTLQEGVHYGGKKLKTLFDENITGVLGVYFTLAFLNPHVDFSGYAIFTSSFLKTLDPHHTMEHGGIPWPAEAYSRELNNLPRDPVINAVLLTFALAFAVVTSAAFALCAAGLTDMTLEVLHSASAPPLKVTTNKTCTMQLTEEAFKKYKKDLEFPEDLMDPVLRDVPNDPVFFLGDKCIVIFDAQTIAELAKSNPKFKHPVTREELSINSLVHLPKLKEQIEAIKAARKTARTDPDE